jgi:hypothetical protein
MDSGFVEVLAGAWALSVGALSIAQWPNQARAKRKAKLTPLPPMHFMFPSFGALSRGKERLSVALVVTKCHATACWVMAKTCLAGAWGFYREREYRVHRLQPAWHSGDPWHRFCPFIG